jgi:hypothetical protein
LTISEAFRFRQNEKPPAVARRNGSDRLAQLAAAGDLSFEPSALRRHQIFDAARRIADADVNLNGKFNMKLFGSRLFGQIIMAAFIGSAVTLSTSASYAQSRPFAGFDGAWSGNGTVSLSDGSTERIRCRADYKVDGSGLGLKQNLRCASDSYKFDLSSVVTSQGDRISGNWSETNRNVSGSLQGTAGGGRIDVFVEAVGFSANLTLRTSGNKQTVQISSKGDIRGVSITMVKS